MGSKRGASGSAVLDLPEESFGSSTDWRGRGPAPAGALQRGRAEEFESYARNAAYGTVDERPYVPRRGSFRLGAALPRSTGGRILLGIVLLLLLAGVGAATVTVRYYLLHDPQFVVATSSDIQVSGNEHLTRGQVLSVFGADLERNIFKVPLAERRADLERLPWVQHATVMRLLPNQLRIAIQERTPVAFVRQGTQIGLVDASGVLLDMPEDEAGNAQYSFPVLTGLAASDPLSTRAARMDIYQKFVAELDGHGRKLSQNLSEVDVSNPEDVKAIVALDGADVLVHFGDEDFLARYKSFEEHLPEWRQQYPKLASADMRYDGQIVLEMQPGAGVPVESDAAGQKASESASQQGSESASQRVSQSANAGASGVATKPTAPKPAAKVAAKPKSAAPPTAAAKAAAAAKANRAKIAAQLAAARQPLGAN